MAKANTYDEMRHFAFVPEDVGRAHVRILDGWREQTLAARAYDRALKSGDAKKIRAALERRIAANHRVRGAQVAYQDVASSYRDTDPNGPEGEA